MKVILFDVDGTLIRAGGAGRKALNSAAYALYGKREVAGELNLAGRTDLWNFTQAFRTAVGRPPSGKELNILHREYIKRLPFYVRKSQRSGSYRLPRGIQALLKRLSREKSVLLGLGTGNLEQGARIKLEPSGFNTYFSFGGFGSDSFERSALLRKAVARARKHLNGQARGMEVFVVGDTPLDVAAGKKAGYKTVAVGTGFSTWGELVRSRPDFLARDFRGIARWLRWFGIKS